MSKTSDLRVISGKYRSRSLKSPASHLTHPMGAREKLALFNIVAVDGQKVLDAYAGSGALGIEALSRNAREVIFVEKSAKITRTIRGNLATLSVASQVFVAKMADFAQRPEYQGYFDVIFADPPYDAINMDELQLLGRLLQVGGTLALSTPSNLEPFELPELRISSTHTYARARITVYRK